jgi:hypothetical protein
MTDYIKIEMFPMEKIEVVVHSLKKIIPENILLTIYREQKEYYEPKVIVHSEPVLRHISIKID